MKREIHGSCLFQQVLWKLYETSDGQSIAMWSENPRESWKKDVRAYQSGGAVRARQNSVHNKIYDILEGC